MTDGKLSIGIIGGGKMGKSLFNLLTGYGSKIVWICRSNYSYESKKFARKLQRKIKNNIITYKEYEKIKSDIIISDSIKQLVDCEIVIETVTENLEIKNKLFKKAGNFLNQSAILVSNSSSIPPENYSLENKYKIRFAGLHFFYPTETTSMVELIITTNTSTQTIEKLKNFCRLIEKRVFLQNTDSKFFINRFFLELQSGLFDYCCLNNISFFAADDLIKREYFAAGIFEMMDMIGADLLHYAISNYNRLTTNLISPENLLMYIEKHLIKSRENNLNTPLFIKSNAEVLEAERANNLKCFVNELFLKIAGYYMHKFNLKQKDLDFIISEYTNSDFNLLNLQT